MNNNSKSVNEMSIDDYLAYMDEAFELYLEECYLEEGACDDRF